MNLINFVPRTLSNLRHAHGELNENWVYQVSTRISLLSLILSLILIFWRWKLLPPMVPLWYSRTGADKLVHPVWLIIFSLTIIFWHAVNMVVSITLIREYRIFIQTLFIVSGFAAILILITVAKVLFLVT